MAVVVPTPIPSNIVDLRRYLAQTSSALRPDKPDRARWETFLPTLDAILDGGLRRGAVTEWIEAGDSSGGQLALTFLLHAARRKNEFVGLIDGCDSFDPESVEASTLPHLLWVRCQKAAEALAASDLLLRDGNLPLLLLDLRINPAGELRRIPSQAWYRLQRLARQNEICLLVLTARALAPSAMFRLSLAAGTFQLADGDAPRETLAPKLLWHMERSRLAPGREIKEA